MTSYHYDTLKMAAEMSGMEYRLEQSPKSEAAYLEIWDGEKRDSNFPLRVRFAAHAAICVRSMCEIEIEDEGFKDYAAKRYEMNMRIDEDGDLDYIEDEDEYPVFSDIKEYYKAFSQIILTVIKNETR